MNLTQIFKRLGFGKNASIIYKTLLDKRRPMLITHIAEAAKIDRPEVYRCLSPLIKQGFVVKTPVGKRCGYSVEDPQRVHSAFIRDANSVNKFTAHLLAKKVLALPAHITYFKGAEGVCAIFNDAIDRMPRGGTFYRYTSERNLAAVNRYLSPDYRVRRDKKKLERVVISNPVSGKAKRQRLERFIKFIPPEADLFDQNVIQLVYADSIAFINLNTEEGYIIRDPDLARFQTVIFKQFYSRLR